MKSVAAYYDALFDEMHRQGIEPMICLEHWELPGVLLETHGGWASSTSSSCSFAMRKRCFDAFTAKSPAGLPSTSRL